MVYDFPIKYFEDNLFINKSSKDCWAAFQMVGYNYDFQSADKKIMLLNKLTRFIAAIGVDAQILIIPVAQDVKLHYKKLVESFSSKDSLYEHAKAHANGSEAYLSAKIERDGNSNDYEVYVLTKLTNRKTSRQIIDDMFRRPKQTIEELFQVEYKEVLLSELKAFTELSDAWFNEQNQRARMEKIDAIKTQWLIRRIIRRGISGEITLRKNSHKDEWTPGKAFVLKDGEKAVRPYEKDILTLTESCIEPGHKNLKITNSDGKVSYQSFLTIAHIPDGLIFPGSEWLLLLQDYPIPSEVCLHINTIEHRESIRKISGKKREIKSQMEHVQGNDDIPEELYEARESVDLLENELKRSRDPLTRVSISICVADEDEQILSNKVNFIRERYADANFVIEHPMTDQFKLFMEFIPSAGRYVKDYILPLPPQTVAGSMFPATRMLGDNVGAYIGTTGILEKPVFLSLARACQLNRSASAAFLGTLGGGKSFNANLLAYLNVMYGGSALIFDPKGERGLWARDIPELADHINTITLSAGDEDNGKLDPYNIYDDVNEASELAQNILCELFKIQPKDDEYTAILEAIQNVNKGTKPSMSAIADYLNNFPANDELCVAGKRIGRRLELLKKSGMTKLLIGTGDERGLNFKNKINIVQIQNLQMPEPSTPKEDYTQEETVSTVLMLPIASFAKQFSKSDKNIFKVIIFDESWALSATQMGIKMMNSLARMGRSLNAGCIFVGHSVTDLKGEGIKNAITYKFCFKATEMNEIKRVLDFLDLEVTDENIKTISNLPNGQCLFQDLEGRVGILKFDATYEHLINAFNTTPGWGRKEED